MSRRRVHPVEALEQASAEAVAAIHAWHAAAQRAGVGGDEMEVALRFTRAAVKVSTERVARRWSDRQARPFASYAACEWGRA